MAILRCASCGAKVKSEEGKFTATCEYCGNEMTVFESTAEFEIDSKGTLVQYNGKGGDVAVPDDVRIIGHHCFFKNERIFSVKLPGSIVEIQERAFEGCSELESINLPDSLEKLSDHVFFECSSLKEIKVPEGVLSLKKSVFCDCSSLIKVVLPDSIRSFESYIFNGCEKLETIKLPKNLRIIGDYSFNECSMLKSVEFGDKIENIGSRAFQKCGSLESLILPDTVEKIKDFAFADCISLKHFSFGMGVREIGMGALKECNALEGEIVIPDSVTQCKWNKLFPIFSDCPNVTKLTIGKGLKRIAMGIGLKYIKQLVLNEGLEIIDEWTFSERQITSVFIPGTVKIISGYAFYDCYSLKRIEIGEGCRNIEKSAFYLSLYLKNKFERTIHLPSTITNISYGAFESYSDDYLTNSVFCPNNQTIKCYFENSESKYTLTTVKTPEEKYNEAVSAMNSAHTKEEYRSISG